MGILTAALRVLPPSQPPRPRPGPGEHARPLWAGDAGRRSWRGGHFGLDFGAHVPVGGSQCPPCQVPASTRPAEGGSDSRSPRWAGGVPESSSCSLPFPGLFQGSASLLPLGQSKTMSLSLTRGFCMCLTGDSEALTSPLALAAAFARLTPSSLASPPPLPSPSSSFCLLLCVLSLFCCRDPAPRAPCADSCVSVCIVTLRHTRVQRHIRSRLSPGVPPC